MARKVNNDLISAIRAGKSCTIGGNTQIVAIRDAVRVYLHGHNIATYFPASRELQLTNCGYHTNVTRDRLNAVLDAFRLPHYIRTRQYCHQLMNGSDILDTEFSAITLNIR